MIAGVIHRDIKPENLMFVNADNSSIKADVKIIDFGLSVRVSNNDDIVKGVQLGKKPGKEYWSSLNNECISTQAKLVDESYTISRA
jgi:serine/threonine protein kinase